MIIFNLKIYLLFITTNLITWLIEAKHKPLSSSNKQHQTTKFHYSSSISRWYIIKRNECLYKSKEKYLCIRMLNCYDDDDERELLIYSLILKLTGLMQKTHLKQKFNNLCLIQTTSKSLRWCCVYKHNFVCLFSCSKRLIRSRFQTNYIDLINITILTYISNFICFIFFFNFPGEQMPKNWLNVNKFCKIISQTPRHYNQV